MVHILTHTDLDGYSAGYVVLQHFGKQNCDIEHFNYDREPNMDKYKEGDTVVITDYSLDNEQYRQILANVGNNGSLIWCDHHISAIKRYMDDPDIVCKGIRSTNYCGAALIWFYFNGYSMEDVEHAPYEELVEKLPKWLRLVDAWDTWKTDSLYYETAKYLNLSVRDILSMDVIEDMQNNLEEYINTGICYNTYKTNYAKRIRDEYMFDVKLNGSLFGVDRDLKCACINSACIDSTYFGDNINTYDVCMTICFNGNELVVSFYSNKDYVDCALAAKQFGGGGHKGASGCTMHDMEQVDLIIIE